MLQVGSRKNGEESTRSRMGLSTRVDFKVENASNSKLGLEDMNSMDSGSGESFYSIEED